MGVLSENCEGPHGTPMCTPKSKRDHIGVHSKIPTGPYRSALGKRLGTKCECTRNFE